MKNMSRPLLWLIVIALIVRGAAVLVKMDSFNEDPDGYRRLAKNLQTEGVYGNGETPTAFRPPLYPVLLRGAFLAARSDARPALPEENGRRFSLLLTENGAIALLHWILGILTVILVYRLALLLTFPQRWAFMTALLVTLDPILINQSRLVMTETLAAFLAVLSVYLLACAMKREKKKISFLGVGFFIGLSALCRPTFLIFAFLSFLMLLNYQWRKKFSILTPGLFLLGVFAAILPWGLRNQAELGEFIVTTTHGGYTLLLANNDFIYERNLHPGPMAGPWDAEEFHQFWKKKVANDSEEYEIAPETVRAELFQDTLAKQTARETMNDNPDGFLLAALIRIGSLWQFLPYRTADSESSTAKSLRWSVGAFYAVEIIFSLIGAIYILSPLALKRHRRIVSPYWSNWSWIFLLIIAVQIVHLFYWTNMRMRAPLMTVIPILAVVGLRLFLNLFQREAQPVVVGGPLRGPS